MTDQSQVLRLFLIAVKSRQRIDALAQKYGYSNDLHKLCAVAALDLFRALRLAGVHPRFAVGQNHCFCIVDDLIVDTTATQFRNADPVHGVWIVALSDLTDDPGVWKSHVIFDKVCDLLMSDIWKQWPASERPDHWDIYLDKKSGEE